MSSAVRKDVFTVVERQGKSFWIKVGAAFTNRDGSMSVLLDALPVNGKLQIRDSVPRDGQQSLPREPAVKEVAPGGFEGLDEDDIPF